MHDFGNTSLTQHILLSSRKDSSNTGPVRSVMPPRTYGDVEHGVEKGDAETYAIQVLNEQRQPLALYTRKNVSIYVPAEEVAEPFVELR